MSSNSLTTIPQPSALTITPWGHSTKTLLSILAVVCCSLEGICSYSYFQVLRYLYLSFGDCTSRTNHCCYHRHFHVPEVYSSLGRSRYLFLFSLFLGFILWIAVTAKSTIRQVLLFLLTFTWSGLLAKITWYVIIIFYSCESFFLRVFHTSIGW